MGKSRTDQQEDTLIQDEIKTDEPRMYKVILLNDDYTSMEFVVLILEQVFHKAPLEAKNIMLSVHEQGTGIAGVYTREIAETKIAIVQHLARQNEFPLKCAMEPN